MISSILHNFAYRYCSSFPLLCSTASTATAAMKRVADTTASAMAPPASAPPPPLSPSSLMKDRPVGSVQLANSSGDIASEGDCSGDSVHSHETWDPIQWKTF